MLNQSDEPNISPTFNVENLTSMDETYKGSHCILVKADTKDCVCEKRGFHSQEFLFPWARGFAHTYPLHRKSKSSTIEETQFNFSFLFRKENMSHQTTKQWVTYNFPLLHTILSSPGRTAKVLCKVETETFLLYTT